MTPTRRLHPGWALEDAINPSVVRLHVDVELTAETIMTCPPAEASPPFDQLLALEPIRSIDFHRHRARLNIRHGVRADVAGDAAFRVLSAAWGPPLELPAEPGPWGFLSHAATTRRVAESPRMAEGHAVLEAVFSVPGVVEAIAGDGMVLVKTARLFGPNAVKRAVLAAVQGIEDAGGTPGSMSGPS